MSSEILEVGEDLGAELGRALEARMNVRRNVIVQPLPPQNSHQAYSSYWSSSSRLRYPLKLGKDRIGII